MIVIGADTHKQTHTIVAVDGATGRELGQLEFSSRPEGALGVAVGGRPRARA